MATAFTRSLSAAATAWAAGCAVAAGADPQSAACRDALGALQAHEERLAAPPSAASAIGPRSNARWQALRQVAVRACLGRETAETTAPRQPSAVAPVAVPPVALPLPRMPVPSTSLPAPVLRPTPPDTLGPCDAIGCWTSSGQRVPHAGRSPLEPRVHCTLQGRVALCL